MMKPIFPALLCAVLTGPAFAQDNEGTISGLVGEVPASWTLDAGQSDFMGNAMRASVSIMGMPVEVPDGLWRVSIGFELVEGQATNPTVSIMRRGSEPMLHAPEATAEVISAVFEGETLTISGSVTAELGESTDYGRTVDMSAPQPVTLTFEGNLAGP